MIVFNLQNRPVQWLKLNRNLSQSTVLLVRNSSSKSRFKFENQAPQKALKPINFLLLIFPATTLCLGIWQTKRRAWKLDLIEQLDRKTAVPPVQLPDDVSDLEEMEYRKIIVRGHFDHSRETYIGPKSYITNEGDDSGGGLFGNPDTVGYNVVTPFVVDGTGGKAILVNRGWVPKRSVNPSTRQEGQIEGTIDLVGIVRRTENRQQFEPKNQGKNLSVWAYRDVFEMAKRLNTLPIFLDADIHSTVPGGPIGGQTKVTLRNDHLSYMFTWYSLTGAMSYLWIRRFIFKK